jgi:cytochrome c oxidase subunit 3
MEAIKKSQYNFQKAEMKTMRRIAAKPLLYISLTSMVTLFAGLTSAYLVRADNGNWLLFKLPEVFIISTAILITSSLTLFIAQNAIKKDNYQLTVLALTLTLILGMTFFFTQINGWQQMTAQGIYFTGKHSNASGSFLYLISLVHLAHMVGGIIAVLVSLIKTLLKKYSSTDYLGIELTSIYWHFLDVLWIYLFLFLYFYR